MRGLFTDGPYGFGWIAEEPALLQRASHALVDAGRVWLCDRGAVDGLAELVHAA